MLKVVSMIMTASVVLAFAVFVRSGAQSQETQSHTKWLAKSLTEMETIKVGMMRADLLKAFTGEGGLSTRRRRQYVYRECPYIKVEVEFEPVGDTEAPEFTESSKDRIIKISKPFLEWPIMD